MEDALIYNGNKLSLEYFDKLINENVWKAFATIHAGIHHQMKIIMRYKFNKNEKGEFLGNHVEKWNIISRKYFAPLFKDLFAVGLINETLKSKLFNFNKARNDMMGHINIYEQIEPSDDEIRKVCLDGIEIVKELDKIIYDIFFPKVN